MVLTQCRTKNNIVERSWEMNDNNNIIVHSNNINSDRGRKN